MQKLLSDKDIAEMFQVSASWSKNQRYLRHNGRPHYLTVDPIYIGSVPRYSAKDIEDWMESRRGAYPS